MCKKAYLGSVNVVKVAATKQVLEPFGMNVFPIDAHSLVGKQPMSDEETIQGAINRAEQMPKDGLRIGLEAGLEFHMGKLFLTNWGVMIDENNRTYIAGGTRIELPKIIETMIFNDHIELADAMERFTKIEDIRSKNGAIGVFTNDLIKRIDIFTHIVKLLYGQYLYYGGKSK